MSGQRVNGRLIVGEEEAGGRLLLVAPQVKQLQLSPHVGSHNFRGPGEEHVGYRAAVSLVVHLRGTSFNQSMK